MKTPESDSSINKVYETIINIFLNKLDNQNELLDRKKDNTEIRDIKKLSRLLYDDSYYWTIDTKWEYLRENSLNRIKRIDQANEKYIKMKILIDTLGLDKNIPKHQNILSYISKDDELSELVLNNLNSISTREKLYELCSPVLLKRFEGNYIRNKNYYMLMMLSSITYHDKYFWATSNGIDIEKIVFTKNNEEKNNTD